MRKRMFFANAGLVLLLACTSGCVVSDFPLSEPASSDADKLLNGRWRTETGDGYTITEFIAPTESSPKARLSDQRLMVTKGTSYPKGSDELQHLGEAFVFVTTIGDTTFLNQEFESGYMIFRYHLKDDTLDIWRMDSTAAAEALGRGDLITGEVTYDKGSVSRVQIKRALKEDGTSATKLRALLTGKEAGRIFPDECKTHYTRVKDKK
ncbi:MAG TPA: hypothetical protein VKD71_10235 [Gemmataceae bacterium]|nr:hypothetical protein [Gemmataceae bacterium]